MNIKLELLKSHIYNYIDAHIADFDIDANKIIDSKSLCLLHEIREIIKNDSYTDFDVVEKIVTLFEANGISCANRHDFG